MARRLPDPFNVTDAHFCARMRADRKWEEEKRRDWERDRKRREKEKKTAKLG